MNDSGGVKETEMRSQNIGNADCKRAQALLDAQLSNELTVEITAQISGQLERCAACRNEFSVRENIKRRLPLTVLRSEVPTGLRRRISQSVRSNNGFRISRLLQ